MVMCYAVGGVFAVVYTDKLETTLNLSSHYHKQWYQCLYIVNVLAVSDEKLAVLSQC